MHHERRMLQQADDNPASVSTETQMPDNRLKLSLVKALFLFLAMGSPSMATLWPI